MRSAIYDRLTLAAIAVGGVLGASLRWLITRPGSGIAGGWFVYAPNGSFTTGTDITGFEPVEPAATLGTRFPVGTLLVNLLGCLLLGALTVSLARRTVAAPGTATLATSHVRRRRLLVGAATGFCGSLTTFSTFATDVASMLRDELGFGRSYGGATLYLLFSLVGGAVAFWVGRTLIRLVTS